MKHMISSYATLSYVNGTNKKESLDYKRKASIIQLVSPDSGFKNEVPFTTDLSGFY